MSALNYLPFMVAGRKKTLKCNKKEGPLYDFTFLKQSPKIMKVIVFKIGVFCGVLYFNLDS